MCTLYKRCIVYINCIRVTSHVCTNCTPFKLRLSVLGVHYKRSLSVPYMYHRQDCYRTWLYEQHRGCLRRSSNVLPFTSTWVYPQIFVGSVLLLFLVFCVVLLCFVCIRPVSFVPNVASVFWLSILDCPFGFL